MDHNRERSLSLIDLKSEMYFLKSFYWHELFKYYAKVSNRCCWLAALYTRKTYCYVEFSDQRWSMSSMKISINFIIVIQPANINLWRVQTNDTVRFQQSLQTYLFQRWCCYFVETSENCVYTSFAILVLRSSANIS